MNRRNQNVHDLAPSYVNILVGLAFREHTATLQEVGYNSISDAEATIFSPFLRASTVCFDLLAGEKLVQGTTARQITRPSPKLQILAQVTPNVWHA